MPRKHISPYKARAELLAIKLEKARYEIRALRRAEREREAALALRKATPDWVDMDRQLKQLELDTEMDAMEAAIDERWPKAPILNFDLMPGFKPPVKDPVKEDGGNHPPAEHPDVAEQRRLDALAAHELAPHELAYANIKRPDPPNGKDWTHPGYGDHRHPADDWRNYE